MTAWLRKRLAATLAGLPLIAATPATAGGLQVSPVSVTLTARESADGLTLSNLGSSTVHAQVRVYRWRQGAEGDVLEPSAGLAISPPMVALEPGGSQLVRVIRTGPAPAAGAAEDTYRIVVDELPLADANAGGGLAFVFRYSLPVFVEPAGTEPRPELEWNLTDVDGTIALTVRNSGRKHAQVADVAVRWSDGERTELAPGLLGYALPGSSITWGTAVPWRRGASIGSLEVRINGQEAQPDLLLAAAPR